MKKRLSLILAVLLCVSSIPAQAADCSAKAMILYEPRTGTVLEEKNADERMLIASTTKIMSALVVLEHCDPTETVQITAAHCAVEGSAMYLRAGERYTVEELLTGLLLVSGNDAALALADHAAGSVAAFAVWMNDKCAELGLLNSHFVNPHGLDDAEHYSSARDLALLTAAAMEQPLFCRIFSCPRAVIHGVTYVNHNKLLNTCVGCIGGKTGYTRAAGRVLVSCVERDGLRLICVTVSDPDDWADHAAAYDRACAAWQYLSFPERSWQNMSLLSGVADTVQLCCGCNGILLPKTAELRILVELPRFVYAPVVSGQKLGQLTVCVDDSPILVTDICCSAEVPLNQSVRLTAREQFRRSWEMFCHYGLFSAYPMES